ncbi:MCE family protein [Gordonia sp. NPDC058843]|uniref:MCE family protein n=1 Tax=Gordonia sp. NPDC058843 TaxID=3346648 RepID=UPI0036BE6E2D
MRPLVRIQLAILGVVAVVSVTVMLLSYIQVQSMIGVGKMVVTVQLPVGGGLYERSNVTYRGVTIGLVESIEVSRDGVTARMKLDDDVEIPRTDLRVNVHSMSAIGEQFIDLVPTDDSEPFVSDGDVLPRSATSIPEQIGPLLDQANELLASIPQGKLRTMVDAAFRTFVGTRDDLIRLVDSTRRIADIASVNDDSLIELIDELGPFLSPHGRSREAITTWTHELARFTEELQGRDPHVRSIIDNSPRTAATAQQLLQDLRPTIPVLLSNLVSLGQVAVTYNPGIEQLFVLTPPLIAAIQTMVNKGESDEAVTAQFHVMGSPLCTTGYLPAEQRRSPADTSYAPPPSNQYCAIPQNSPMNVRGARNLPCMEVPGRRAPTPEACRDPRPYQPKGPMPSSIDGSGDPDQQGLIGRVQPSAYDNETGAYVAEDGAVYHHRTIGGGTPWQELLRGPQK